MTTLMLPIEEVRRLDAAATKGPWVEWMPPINGGEENPDCQIMAAARNNWLADRERLEKCIEALKFYADSRNYLDAIDCDGDINPLAIPVTYQQEARPVPVCDCGDIAKTTLHEIGAA